MKFPSSEIKFNRSVISEVFESELRFFQDSIESLP